MEDSICLGCIEDEFLRRQVASSARLIKCTECSEQGKGITIDELGELLEPVMPASFELTPENPYGFDTPGDDIEYVIGATLRQDLKCMQALIEAVCRADPAWPPHGEEPFWEQTSSYTEHTLTTGRYRHAWDSALDQLKARQRYFSSAPRELFEKIFADVDQIKTASMTGLSPVVQMLPAGSVFYRARVCAGDLDPNDAVRNPLLRVGPPLSDKARAGRMNAEGVVVFTALAIEIQLSPKSVLRSET